jgi:small subunit ribosomal protein S4
MKGFFLKFKPCRQTFSALWPTRSLTRKQSETLLRGKKTKQAKAGISGNRSRGFASHGHQLAVKRVISYLYGVSGKELKVLFRQAKQFQGKLGPNLLGLLERKLDVVLYKINFCTSLRSAKQLISHGKVRVNGKQARLPHYQMQPGDVITLLPGILDSVGLVIKPPEQDQTPVANLVNHLGLPDTSKAAPKKKAFGVWKVWADCHKARFGLGKVLSPKCSYLEVNYRTAAAIFLFSPQTVLTPTPIHLNNLLKSY